MRTHRLLRRTGIAVATCIMCVTTLAACGSSSSSGSATTSSGHGITKLGELLPASVRKTHTLVVGMDVSYAPMEFYEAGTMHVRGVDADLCRDIAAQFGSFTCDFDNTPFSELIPGLQAGRFTFILSAISDTPAREKLVTFVDYFETNTAIVVAKGNPDHIHDLADLCGHTMAVQLGTADQQLADMQAAACQKEGKPLTVLTYQEDTSALMAITDGRSVADLDDYPVAVYNAKTAGGGTEYQAITENIESRPYGIAIPLGATNLEHALLGALRAIRRSGQYAAILRKWGVSDAALPHFAVDAAGSTASSGAST